MNFKLLLPVSLMSLSCHGAAMSRAMGTVYPLYVSEMEDSLVALKHYQDKAVGESMVEYWGIRIASLSEKLERIKLIEKTRLKVLYDIESSHNGARI